MKTPRESANRLPPRKNLDGWWTSFRSGLWRLKFQLSPEGNKRYDDLVSVLHDTKISVLGDRDNEAWYLLYLGTKPGARGKGYAKKLLDDMIQRVSSPFPNYLNMNRQLVATTDDSLQADAENQPVYLESTTESNNRYYRKFGFDVMRDICLTRGLAPVHLSIMVRDPRCLRKFAYSDTATAPIKMQPGGGKMG